MADGSDEATERVYWGHYAAAHPRVMEEWDGKRRLVRLFASGSLLKGNRFSERALRLLALPYAAHPDYDESWAL